MPGDGDRMDLKIIKPGQGYWVRMLTAVFTGVLVLSAAVWAWNDLDRVERYLIPIESWTLTVNSDSGAVNPGDVVDLYVERPAGDSFEMVSVGTGELLEGSAGSQTIRVHKVRATSGEASQIREVRTGDGYIAKIAKAVPKQQFDPQYLKGAVAGFLLLVGGFFIFRFVGSKPRTVDFLIATDGEMRKVNWSTRRDVIGSTVVVIALSFLVAAGLYGVDFIFNRVFTFVGVLDS